MSSLENTVKSLETLPAQVAALDHRMTGVESRLGVVESQIVEHRLEMRDGISAIRQEIATKADKADLGAIREELATKANKADLGAIREEMATKADLAAVRQEMANMADGLRAEIAESRTHTRLLFEEYVGRLRIVDERRDPNRSD